MNLTEVSWVLKHNNPKAQLILIEWLVSLTFLFLMLLLPVGILRRQHSSIFLKLFAWGTYSAVTLLIAYIFGLMRNLGVRHELVTIWAAFLLVVYGKTATALGLSDQKSGVAYLAKLAVYITYIALMFAQISYSLSVPLVLVLLFSDFFFKTRADFISKSRECVVEDITVKSDEYMPSSKRLLSNCVRSGDEYVRELRVRYRTPMHKCQYVVDPKSVKIRHKRFVHEEIMTICKIWRDCEQGSLLIPAFAHKLKSTCLSLSLFWLLLHKYAGLPPYESSQQEEAWELIINGIIDSSDRDICPFEVIEVELAFLYDYFYNRKHLSFYKNKFWVELMRRLLFLGSIAWVVVFIFKNYRPKEERAQTVRIQYHQHDMDILVTGVVILTITLLELVQFAICLCSRWSKVRLLCIYLRRSSWKRKGMLDCYIHVAAHFVFHEWKKVFKPWQRSLGQYSLMESYTYMQNPLLKNLLLYVNSIFGIRIASPGREQSRNTPLSDEIKQALVRTVQVRGLRLSNGIGSLLASELPLETKKILATFVRGVSDDHLLISWHIATSVCEIHQKKPHDEIRQSADFKVATSLSKYCAYLAAFAPELLPGNPTTTDGTCTTAIEEAYGFINALYDKRGARQSGRDISYVVVLLTDLPISDVDMRKSSILLGVRLGEALRTRITDEHTRWRLLADVWAEMILYLAPNTNNEWEHAEKLADGGEFITHLWALLFHAGVVDRNQFYDWENELVQLF